MRLPSDAADNPEPMPLRVAARVQVAAAVIKPLRIEMRIRNNALIRRREELGMSPAQLAESSGVGYGDYLDYESMKKIPVYAENRLNLKMGRVGWRESAQRLAKFHGVSPSTLWPDEVLQVRVTRAVVEADASDLGALLGAPPQMQLDDKLFSDERREILARAVGGLTAKEAMVIRARFGESPETLEEIGARIGVQGERIRQIEAKALRKLRDQSKRRGSPLRGIS